MRLTGLLSMALSTVTLATSGVNVISVEALDRLIPWSSRRNQNLEYPLRLDTIVNGIEFNVPVDTGSTGFLIAARSLGYQDETRLSRYPPGRQYLSSSRRYYKGYWVPSDLSFTSITGLHIWSQVPVLAVTETGRCSSFRDGNCIIQNGTSMFMPFNIQYLGIGFGRWSHEQPDATPDKNPMLNVMGIGGPLRGGYIISSRGIVLGLSERDLDDSWSTMKLQRNLQSPKSESWPDWYGPDASIKVSDGAWLQGTALLDTGIDYSYLGVPKSAIEGMIAGWKNPVNGKTLPVLVDGTAITIKLGSEVAIAEYSFTVGDFENQPMVTPARVRVVKEHDGRAYINTGRFFFNGFSLLFDEQSGTLGLKQAYDPGLHAEGLSLIPVNTYEL